MHLYSHKLRFYTKITREGGIAVSENFRKIKKKYLTIAIVAACILGVCSGVAFTCTLAVVLKIYGVNFMWALYIPVAAALSAGAGALFFLILKPNDKRVAKKLDKDYKLNQKVQTMVEFAGAEGAMPALQREQTNDVLGGVAKKRADLKWLAKFAVVPVIALAMLFAGIFVPAKKSSGYEDPPFDMTDAQITALTNLITDVNGSELETELKGSAVNVLNELLEALKRAEQQSVMKATVISSVRFIDAMIAAENSYLNIDNVFKSDTQLALLSTAVVDSVVFYKNGPLISTMSAVNGKVEEADAQMLAVLKRWYEKFLKDYASAGQESENLTYLPVTEAAAKLNSFAYAFKIRLDDSRLSEYAPVVDGEGETVSAGDPLYNVYTALCERFENLAKEVLYDVSAGGYTDASFYNTLKGSVDESAAFTNAVIPVLTDQSYNCMMDEFIRNALARIFNINRNELGSNENVAPQPSEPLPSNPDDGASNGGYADGVHKYGSDDEILDVNTGEKKPYGSLINPDDKSQGTIYDKYYNRVLEYINEGACSQEVAEYIRQYFAYLSDGVKEEEKNAG